MKQMENTLESVGLAGRRVVRWVNSFLPCTPYNIYNCTIDRYVSIVVEGQYRKIIKSGICSKDKQIEFINQLCFEFGQAKDDLKGKADNHDRENLFELNIEVQRLYIALFLCIRDFKYSLEILKELGLPYGFKEVDGKMIDFIKSQIKRRNVDIKNINAKLLKENESNERVTRQMYVDILENYESNIYITLSEFAAKIKKNRKIAEEYEKLRRSNS